MELDDDVVILSSSSSRSGIQKVALAPEASAAAVDDSTSVSAFGAAGSRGDVLTDFSKSFADAFAEWLSLQGADHLLKDDRYDEIIHTLQQKDARHAKYRAWSAKYQVVTLPTDTYLVTQCDLSVKAKPRGAHSSAIKNKPASSTAGVSDVVENLSSSNSVHSAPKPPLIVTKRVPRASEIESIIASAHGSGPQGSGHGGYDATYNKIKLTFTSVSRPLVIAYCRDQQEDTEEFA